MHFGKVKMLLLEYFITAVRGLLDCVANLHQESIRDILVHSSPFSSRFRPVGVYGGLAHCSNLADCGVLGIAFRSLCISCTKLSCTHERASCEESTVGLSAYCSSCTQQTNTEFCCALSKRFYFGTRLLREH